MSENTKIVSPEAVIQFPTGAIKASTLDQMLRKIPFELGYCDENDIFRWFSDKPNRLSPRHKETIGQKVLPLHGNPQMEARVAALLESFAKGEKQDFILRVPNPAGEANMRYTKFMAVHDADGNYIGSMDATVDLDNFKGKSGKRTPDTISEFPAEAKSVEASKEVTALKDQVVDMDAVIDFPSGAIKGSTLYSIINLCPFEMGFCDAEDNFRWYSDNPTRVHKRRVEAIGHSVLTLHPKVATHVQKLLQDFHEGKRDEWEFWFPKRSGEQGQMYQKFMALRDEKTGEYLGCMDITVNIDQFFTEEELAAMDLGPKAGQGHPGHHPGN